MLDSNQLYPKMKNLSFRVLKMIFFKYDMKADDEDLIIALNILKNNPYPLINKEYAPVVLNKIRKSTNENMYNCFKQIIEEDYLLEEIY